MSRQIRHACAVGIEQGGILIEGPSGSGKTSLMFALVETLRRNGLKAGIISDDYTQIQAENGRLRLSAPEAIAGKAEVRGFGIVPVALLADAVAMAMVRMVRDAEVERMPEARFEDLLGVRLPMIEVPQRHEQGAVRIVSAWLSAQDGICLPFPLS